MFSKVKCQMKKSQFKMAAAGLWFSLLSSMAAQAQDCDATATITLINQAQVDNFATTYGACDTTPYGLTIEGSDITLVDALSALVTTTCWVVSNSLRTPLSFSRMSSMRRSVLAAASNIAR